MAASTQRPQVVRLEDRTTPTTIVNLTTAGSSGSAAGADFVQAAPQPTGTGNIHTFVRIKHADVERGYNTDARPLQFNESRGHNVTRSLQLDEVPVVNRGGHMYREFLLNINQKHNRPLLSLDAVRIYMGTTPNATGYNSTTNKLAGLSPVFDLDAGGDTEVLLNDNLNSGHGKGDMLMYVPDELFVGGTFVYLFSKFGAHKASNGGFEEWAVRLNPITQPGGAISGTKFNDMNGNGVRDDGEPGMSGWVIYLDSNNNNVLDDGETSTITDENGHYRFSDLTVGAGIVYRVREVLQSGWFQTTPNPSNIILLSPNDEVTNVDFGSNFFGE